MEFFSHPPSLMIVSMIAVLTKEMHVTIDVFTLIPHCSKSVACVRFMLGA